MDEDVDASESLYAMLAVANDMLDAMPSPSPSRPVTPSTLDRNRTMIEQITERMLDRGQIKPLSTQEQIDTLASTVAEISTPTASQTMELNIVVPVSVMMGKLKRVVRQTQPDLDIEDIYEEISHALDAIDTPTPSQPRDPQILQRGKAQLDDLTARLQDKQMIPPPVKRKSRNKVSPTVFLGTPILMVDSSAGRLFLLYLHNRRVSRHRRRQK